MKDLSLDALAKIAAIIQDEFGGHISVGYYPQGSGGTIDPLHMFYRLQVVHGDLGFQEPSIKRAAKHALQGPGRTQTSVEAS